MEGENTEAFRPDVEEAAAVASEAEGQSERQPSPSPKAVVPKRKNMVTSWDFLGMKAGGKVAASSGNPKAAAAGRQPERRSGNRSAVTPTSSGSAASSERRPASATLLRGRSDSGRRSGTSEQPQPSSATSRGRPETAARRSIRQAVAEKVESFRSSPRFHEPKRLGTNSSQPRLLMPDTARSQVARSLSNSSASKRVSRSSLSPAVGVGPAPTPEVMKTFRQRLLNKNLTTQVTVDDFKVKKAGPEKKASEPMKAAVPKLMVPTLTKPIEFKFATDNRVKEANRRVRAASGGSNASDFQMMLRSYGKSAESDADRNKGPTKVEPFLRLESNRKRSHSADPEANSSNSFKSMAEQIKRFQLGTPDRFHSRPRNVPARNTPKRRRSVSPNPRLTVPKTPQLTTKNRSRPVHVLSQAEREELELQQIKKHQFKAHGVGETLPKFKTGAPIETKPSTIPQPFNLAPSQPKPIPPPSPKAEIFHARPLNKKILEGPVGVPEKHVMPLVAPESPAFALKQRMVLRKPAAAVEPEQPDRKLVAAVPKRAPHRGVPVPPTDVKKTTAFEPFSFEDRNQALMAKKEDKIKKLLEEEKAAREFHANPLPKGTDHPKLPERRVVAATKPEPFNLNIEQRVETRLNKWQEEVAKELEEQKRAAIFKASEPKVLAQAPFMPKPSEKPLAEISNFTLHSERRAEERQAFDMERRKKEVDLEEAKRQREERTKREEEAEIARLRREAVHKAQPIRTYKPVEVKPSDRPLTVAASPKFTARGRNNSTMKLGNDTTSSH